MKRQTYKSELINLTLAELKIAKVKAYDKMLNEQFALIDYGEGFKQYTYIKGRIEKLTI